MLRENDKVRFVDKRKDKKFGVLTIFIISGDIATIGNGDYATLGQNIMSVNLNEIKRAE